MSDPSRKIESQTSSSGVYTPQPETRKAGANPQGSSSPHGDLMGQLEALLNPLVNHTGVLDFGQLTSKTENEFLKFLQDQAGINDGKSFRNPYQKLLKQESYEVLLRSFYRYKISSQLQKGLELPKLEQLQESFKNFQTDLIRIDADRFVQQHFSSQEGCHRLAGILHTLSADQILKNDKNLRSDFTKALARAGKYKVGEELAEEINSQISTWNYFNLSVTPEELEAATHAAEEILTVADKTYSDLEQAEKDYLEKPEAAISQNLSQVTAELIHQHSQWARQKLAQPDTASQFSGHLAKLWLMTADDRNWTSDKLDQKQLQEIRSYLLIKTEALLQKSENLKTDADLQNFNEELQEFLHGKIRANEWLKHLVVGAGLEDFLKAMPDLLHAPFDQLLQVSDEFKAALAMGKKKRTAVDLKHLKSEEIKKRVTAIIEGLDKTERTLWYNYKQHKALSRAGSNIALLFGAGDITDIRAAGQEIDGMIQRLSQIKSDDDAEIVIQAEIERLFTLLEEGGTLYKALVAAEMDGIESTLGFIQTMILIVAPVGIVGVAARLAKLSQGILAARAIAAGQGTAQAAGTTEVAGAATAAATGTATTEAAATTAEVAEHASVAVRMAKSFGMGAYITSAENAMAVATGEVRHGPETVQAWFKDAIATGLSMSLIGLLPVSHVARENLIKNLFARYTVGGVRAARVYLVDTGMETIQEIMDQYIRQVLNGNSDALSWGELSELVYVCLPAGGLKVGLIAEIIRGKSPSPQPSPLKGEGETSPSPLDGSEEVISSPSMGEDQGGGESSLANLKQLPDWQSLQTRIAASQISAEDLETLAAVVVEIYEKAAPIFAEHGKVSTTRDLLRLVDIVAKLSLKQKIANPFETIRLTLEGQFANQEIREKIAKVVTEVESGHSSQTESGKLQQVRNQIREVLSTIETPDRGKIFDALAKQQKISAKAWQAIQLKDATEYDFREDLNIPVIASHQESGSIRSLIAFIDFFKILGGRSYLEKKLFSELSFIQLEAALALGKLGDPAACIALKEVLDKLGDPSPEDINISWSRVVVAGALGRLGHPDGIPALKKIMNNDQPLQIRERAAETLKNIQAGKIEVGMLEPAFAKLGNNPSITFLKQALTDPDSLMNAAAYQILEKQFPGWDEEYRIGLDKIYGVIEEELTRPTSTQHQETTADAKGWIQHLSHWNESSSTDSSGKPLSAEKTKELESLIPNQEKVSLVASTVDAMKGLVAGILSKSPVYLEGETGVGKNALIRYLAHLTGTPLFRINFGRETDETQLYGHYEMQTVDGEGPSPLAPLPQGEGNLTTLSSADAETTSPSTRGRGARGEGQPRRRVVLTDGKMVEALRHGGWVIWDEVNLANEGFLVAQNDIVQQIQSGKVLIKQGGKIREIPVHKNFRLFATGNPEGYSGRAALERSFADRWLKVAVREFSVEEQQTVLREIFPDLDEISVVELPKILNELKNAIGEQGPRITLRTLKRVAARVAEEGPSPLTPLPQGEGNAIPTSSNDTKLFISTQSTNSLSPLPEGEGPGVRALPLWSTDPQGKPTLTESGMKVFVQAIEAEVLDGLAEEQFQNVLQILEKVLPASSSFPGSAWERTALEAPPPLKEGRAFEALRSQAEPGNESSDLSEGERALEQGVETYRNTLEKTVTDCAFWESLVPVATTVHYATKVLDSLIRGDFLLLEGPPAVSKSAIPKWIGKLTGQEVIEVTGSKDHSVAEMVGMPTLDENGNLVFQKGYFVEAIERGAILILNEANLIPASVLERLNSVFDDDRNIFITENGLKRPIAVHKNFRLVLTQNPAGMRGGRVKLSPALENKFRKIVFRKTFSQEELAQIVAEQHPELREKASVMAETFEGVKKVFAEEGQPLTLRDLHRWASIATTLGYEHEVLAPDQALAYGAELVFAGRTQVDSLQEKIKSVTRTLGKESALENQDSLRAEIRTILSADSTTNLREIYEKVATRQGLSLDVWLAIQLKDATETEVSVTLERADLNAQEGIALIVNFKIRGGVAYLIAALKDADSKVRESAAKALGALGDKAAIPTLIAALKDAGSNVRRSAAEALGALGDKAASLTLIAALKDAGSNVRRSAAEALGALGDKAAIPDLIAALEDADSKVRESAAKALGALGDKAAIPDLIAALEDADSKVRESAAEALGALGDKAAIPTLIAALKDDASNVRRSAAKALGALGDKSASPTLIAALKDDASYVRSSAAEALGALGDKAAVPDLIAALKDDASNVRSSAAEALGALGDKSAVPDLIAALEDADSKVRESAAEALGALGNKSAIPDLIAALNDAGSRVRMEAAKALGALGDKSAVPDLIAALKDAGSGVRAYAAEALGALGDKSAIPNLIAALKDYASYVRSSAAEALGKISPDWDAEFKIDIEKFSQIIDEELSLTTTDHHQESSADAKGWTQHLSQWNENSSTDSFGKPLSAEKLQELESLIPKPEKISLVGSTVEALKGLVSGVLSRSPVYLEGETGVGKNALIRYLAHLTGTPLFRINFGRETDETQLYGHYEMQSVVDENGKKQRRVVLTDGKMIEALRFGGWVIWDEVNLGNEGFLVAQNDIVQQIQSGKVLIKQGGKIREVSVHENFRLFATGNPEGYSGRAALERSFADRWLKIAVREFSVEEQQTVLREILPDLDETTVVQLPQILNELKTAIGDQGPRITLRTLKRVAGRIGEGGPKGPSYEDAPEGASYHEAGSVEPELVARAFRPVREAEGPSEVTPLWTTDPQNKPTLTESGMRIFVQAIEAEVLDGLAEEQFQNVLQILEKVLPAPTVGAGSPRPISARLSRGDDTRGNPADEGGVTPPLPTMLRQQIETYRNTLEKTVEDCAFWESLVPVATTVHYATKVLDSLIRGDFLLLEGPPAVSKSAIPKWLGKLSGQEVIEVTGNKDHSVADMVGMPTLDENGNLVFQKGYFVEAIERGAILILNEANLIPASVLERLNSVFDDDRNIFITENGVKQPIAVHKNFRLVLTQNPAGMRGGRVKLSPALENKFRKIVFRNKFTAEELRIIVRERLGRNVRRGTSGSGNGSGGMAFGPEMVGKAFRPDVARVFRPARGAVAPRTDAAGLKTLATSDINVLPTNPDLKVLATNPNTTPQPGKLFHTLFGRKDARGFGPEADRIPQKEILEAEQKVQEAQDEMQKIVETFMQQHRDSLQNLGSVAARKAIRIEVNPQVDIAAMDMDKGIFYINPSTAHELTPQQIAAVALHEGGHSAVSRVGDGFFFENSLRHLLANSIEDPRVNEYQLFRFPGARGDFASLYEKFFPNPQKIREANARGEIPPLGALPHEQFALGFIDLWANRHVTERVSDTEVRAALESLASVAQQIWQTHPNKYQAREREILSKQNEVYERIKNEILPIYEKFCQKSEEKLREQGASPDQIQQAMEGRAGKLAEGLEPRQLPPMRQDQIDRARRNAARKNEEAKTQGQETKPDKGKGDSKPETTYKPEDFRPYDQRTFKDILEERKKRKASAEAFYDQHPYRRYFDPISKIAQEVAEGLKQILKLDADFEYEGNYVSGSKLNVRKAIDTLVRNEAGIFSEEDFKLFLRKRFPTRRSHKFVLVLDESGSMKGENQKFALQAVALFEHVLHQLGIDYAEVGFSDTAEVRKDFSEEFSSEKQKDAHLGEFESAGGGGTNDLEGVKVADDLLKSEEADEKTVIVITDGAGVDETSSLVKEMEKRGIQVIGIGVGAGTEAVKDVYPDHYQSGDFRNLPKELVRILVKRILGGSR